VGLEFLKPFVIFVLFVLNPQALTVGRQAVEGIERADSQIVYALMGSYQTVPQPAKPQCTRQHHRPDALRDDPIDRCWVIT